MAPAALPEHFADRQMLSAIWLVFMGGLQATAGATLLVVEAINQARRLFALVTDSLDHELNLADFRRTVLQPSFYTLVEDFGEKTGSPRLQPQLRQAA